MQISNDKQCEHAKTSKVQEDFPVAGVPGFALRVSRDGRKSWTLRYRTMQRKQRRLTLGQYPEASLKAARDRARQLLADVAKGGDPARAKQERRGDATFTDLFQHWYDKHAKPKLARPEHELGRYELHVKQPLGDVVAKTLTRQDVGRVRDNVTEHSGATQANRVLALVSRVLHFACEEGLLEANPAPRIRKNAEKPRERVLSDDELANVWGELERCEKQLIEAGNGGKGRHLSIPMIRAIRLLILTGQRRAEVIGAELGELRLNSEPVWTIPGRRTKNGLLHILPLPPIAAYEFRRAIAEAAAARYVFPSSRGAGEHIVEMAVTAAFKRTCKRLKIEGASVHDLRRTVGTGMARLKVPPHVRSLVLNHAKKASDVTTAVYDRHGYDDEKLEALTAWEAYVRKVVSLGDAHNVTPLRGQSQ